MFRIIINKLDASAFKGARILFSVEMVSSASRTVGGAAALTSLVSKRPGDAPPHRRAQSSNHGRIS